MTKLEGFWDTELRKVVKRVQSGGAVRVLDQDGEEVIVRVMPINPARIGKMDGWA